MVLIMEYSFGGGIKASNYRHVHRIYELEGISEDEKNKYINDLKKINLRFILK